MLSSPYFMAAGNVYPPSISAVLLLTDGDEHQCVRSERPYVNIHNYD